MNLVEHAIGCAAKALMFDAARGRPLPKSVQRALRFVVDEYNAAAALRALAENNGAPRDLDDDEIIGWLREMQAREEAALEEQICGGKDARAAVKGWS